MDLFDATFAAISAWNQFGILLIGLALTAVGVFLTAWFFYTRLEGRKVTARLVGVRATGIGGKSAVAQALEKKEPEPEPTWESFGQHFKENPGSGLAGLFFAFLIIGVPLVFIGFGLWFGLDYLRLSARGVETAGTVIENVYRSGDDGGTYHAVIAYEDSGGRAWRVEERIGKGGSPFFGEGEKVTVHYDAADPEHMVAGGFWHNILLPLVFTAMGGGVLFLMLAGPRLAKKAAAKPAAKKKNFAGEMYYPVYEYEDESGATVRAEGDTGTNWLTDKIPGMLHQGYIQPHNPETVTRPGFLTFFFALLFGGPGVALIVTAFTAFEFNPLTLVFLLGFMAWTGRKFKKIIKPKEQRESKAAFQARRKEKRAARRAEGRLLTALEIRERLLVQQRYIRMQAPVLILLAALLLGGGAYLGRDMSVFLTTAETAPGEVVRLERSKSSGGGDYTYYPVVSFQPEGGPRIEFRDNTGTNPPLYSEGDAVEVLYDPAEPDDAIINRGLMNWLGAAACLLAGFLLFWATVKSWAAASRYKAHFPL